jgi:hypothetical protein
MIFAKGDDQVTPSNFVHDGNGTSLVNNGRGPYICGVEYWVDTPDAGVAGSGWGVAFEYEDPTGIVIALGGTPLDISTAGGRVKIPLETVSRNTPTSLFRVVGTLIGPAGTSKVSWRTVHLPVTSSEVVSWP